MHADPDALCELFASFFSSLAVKGRQDFFDITSERVPTEWRTQGDSYPRGAGVEVLPYPLDRILWGAKQHPTLHHPRHRAPLGEETPAFGLSRRSVGLEIKAQIHAASEGSRIATFFFTPIVQYLIFVAKDLRRHVGEIPPIGITSSGAQGTFLAAAANP